MAFKLVTFDVYMALIDIQGTMTPVVSELLDLSLEDASPTVRLWRAKQMERAAASNSLGKERTSFRECTRQALDYVLRLKGRKISDDVREQLVLAWIVSGPGQRLAQLSQRLNNEGIELPYSPMEIRIC